MTTATAKQLVKRNPAKKPAAKRLPSLASLKQKLEAGADTSAAKAEANARKLIGRSRI